MRSFLELAPVLSSSQPEATIVGSVGGRARLPVKTAHPRCTLCEEHQTFFLQIAFPNEHAWAGFSIAVFACTRCVSEERLIPEMLSALRGTHVTAEFLRRYQRNFHVIVFPTGVAQSESTTASSVAVRALRSASAPTETTIGLIGGAPRWVLEDESPALIAGKPAVFLFQLFGSLRFPIVPTAPPQKTLALDGSAEDSTDDFYELFIGNDIYFFGGAPTDELVYVFTQVD